MKSTQVTPAAGAAVGVGKGVVVGRSLESGAKAWQISLPVIAEPAVAGNVAVLSTAQQFVAVDSRSGQTLWSIPAQGRPLFGIDDDGRQTVMTLGPGAEGGSSTIVVDRSGSTTFDVGADHLLGAPAIRGNLVFVPWNNQFVSVFEVKSESEVGRVLMHRQVSQAVSIDNQLYFGEQGLLLFDERVARGGAGHGAWIMPHLQPLPGDPVWFERGYRVLPLPGGAKTGIRLFARPDGNRLDSGTYAASYFRVSYGVNAESGKVRWVHSSARPVLGGTAVAGGYVLCTADGKLTALESLEGRVTALASLGQPLSACGVAPGTKSIARGSGQAKPFDEQLTEALLLSDPQMAAAQAFLLEQINERPEPTLTKTLIDVIQDPRATPTLAQRANELLAQRRVGAEYMLEALQRHYDFLAGVLSGPPVAALAEALAALNEKAAAPYLAKHLNDPTHDAKSIAKVAEGLQVLAGGAEADELRTFFSMYRATADTAPLIQAVVTVARTLMKVGDRDTKLAVQAAAEDQMTHPKIRQQLAKMFETG